MHEAKKPCGSLEVSLRTARQRDREILRRPATADFSPHLPHSSGRCQLANIDVKRIVEPQRVPHDIV